MIESLRIQNYRGIKSLELKNLKKINVFIGRNNSGKSSLLESLYLASAAFNFKDVLSSRFHDKIEYLLNRRCPRSLSWDKAKEVLWYNYNTEIPIEIELGSGSNKLRINLFDWHQHPLIKYNLKKQI